jgi:hypothetical protein
VFSPVRLYIAVASSAIIEGSSDWKWGIERRGEGKKKSRLVGLRSGRAVIGTGCEPVTCVVHFGYFSL